VWRFHAFATHSAVQKFVKQFAENSFLLENRAAYISLFDFRELQLLQSGCNKQTNKRDGLNLHL
jgi:hypothetical protein